MSLQRWRHAASSHCFAVLVVLALAFKALLPTGFMLASVEGQLQLVMCPAGIHVPAMNPHAAEMPANMSMDIAMQHGAGGDHAAHAAHAAMSADQCPFAQAMGAAVQTHTARISAPYFAILRPIAPAAVVSVPFAPPLRHLAPRGPPSLA